MVLLSAAVFSGILLISASSLYLMNEVKIGGSAYRYIQKDKDALESIALLKSDLFQINSEMQNLMLKADTATAAKNITTMKSLSNDLELNFGIVLESLASAEKLASINKANTVWLEYQKTLLEELLPAAARGDVVKAGNLMTGIQAQRFATFSKAVALMVDPIRQDVSTAELQVASKIRKRIALSIAASTIVIGLIALFSFFITTSITKPLRSCLEFAKALAGGKLDARLEVRGGGETGELAHAMNTMAENLHSMVSRIGSASEVLTSIDSNLETAARQVVSSAQMQEKSVHETAGAVAQITDSVHEVFGGIDKLAESASETSSSSLEMAATIEEIAMSAEKLEEAVEEVSASVTEMASSIKEIGTSIVNLLDASTTTASSIAEMDATIRQVEKNAMDTASISESVRNDAEIGKNAVLEAIAGMQAIRASSQITSEVVETLSLRVNDIGAILSVIDEVAEQTNLLALNAAIIAAQAGEHGKGFAVVADEIKELAERTSSSTREIAQVIRGVQDETQRAVEAINQAEKSIAEGEMLSQKSGEALNKIVGGVNKSTDRMAEIARATGEQARGSLMIRDAMEKVSDMVAQIAKATHEQGQGSELITVAVQRMKDLTAQVRASTREQSKVGGFIARSTENITDMIQKIKLACDEQSRGSEQVVVAVEDIRHSTDLNLEAINILNDALASLLRQTAILNGEIVVFKV